MEFYTVKKNLVPYSGKKPKISLIGIPFDTTSIEYPGSRFGPKEIRDILARQYGVDLDSKINFYEQIEDLGDIDVVHGSFEETHKQIDGFINAFSEQRKTIPCFIGGEHSITYSTISSLKKHQDFDLIVFDAHADCFETYKGESMSHISYLNKLVSEKIIDNVHICGARAITPEELKFMKQNKVSYYAPKKIDVGNICRKTKKKVYLSIDIDVLDYHLAIGSGCPEYNGLTLNELIDNVAKIIRNKEVIGFDIVETNPMLDGSRITVYSAALLLRQIIIELAKKKKN